MKINFRDERVMVPMGVGLAVIALIVVSFVVKDCEVKLPFFFFALYVGFMCAVGLIYRHGT